MVDMRRELASISASRKQIEATVIESLRVSVLICEFQHLISGSEIVSDVFYVLSFIEGIPLLFFVTHNISKQ